MDDYVFMNATFVCYNETLNQENEMYNQENSSLDDVTSVIRCYLHYPKLMNKEIIKAGVLFVMAALSTVGNIFVIADIRCSKEKKHVSLYFLIFHLAVSDLFITAFCLVPEACWRLTVQWFGGTYVCKVSIYMAVQ